jgi:hypothetical protein
MYGVPDTCAISDINAARANIWSTLTGSIARTQSQHLSKAVALITIRAMMWSRTLNFLPCNSMGIHCVLAVKDSFWAGCDVVAWIRSSHESDPRNCYLISTVIRVSHEIIRRSVGTGVVQKDSH